MSVETSGRVRLRDETGPGLPVEVTCRDGRLRLIAGERLVGDWLISDLGIHAVQEGFAIRAEGEELILTAKDDAALAEEMGLVAATPRLARKVAALHPPEERPAPPEPLALPTHVGAIAFALSGALVLLGGLFLRSAGGEQVPSRGMEELWPGSGLHFWVLFVIGGGLMVAAAYVLSLSITMGRLSSILVMGLVIVVFALAVGDTATDASHLTAYGFLSGGIVVGVAVLFSGPAADRG